MSDVKLYKTDSKQYNTIQYSRPDYRNSVSKIIQLAKKYLPKKATIYDFCSGAGSIVFKITKEKNIKEAHFIDINEEMLKQIPKTNKFKTIIIHSNILKANTKQNADIILNTFSLHHINKEKKEYVEKISQTMNKNGIAIVAEIFVPNKKIEIEYYEKLILEIHTKNKTEQLTTFLRETARSQNCEFKISKQESDDLFKEGGLKLIEEHKIWPLDNEFGKEIGTFVQIYKKK